jgi:hypothetical protein
MRPLLTLLMVALLIGGTWSYIKFKNSVSRPASVVETKFSQKPTRLKILRSAPLFDGGALGGPAVEVAIKSNSFLTINRSVPPDEPIEVEIPDVEIGKNTVNVAVNFEDPEAFLSDAKPLSLYAMEVIVLQGSRELHRQTFTSAEPFVVGGDVLFRVDSAQSLSGANSHDHSAGDH